MNRWLRRILIAAALIAVAAGVFFESVTHIGRGRWYGEPFYEGRPASYWADEIERWEPKDAVWDRRNYHRRPPWPQWVERRLPEPRWPPLLDGDPDGLAVLQALRNHPSSEVQDWARVGIERIDNEERGPCKIPPLSIIVTARLYEVDEAFYKELAKTRRHSLPDLEEMERIRLDGPAHQPWSIGAISVQTVPSTEKKPAGESLFHQLGKQKLLKEVKEIKIGNNQEGGLLSTLKESNCSPSPPQMRKRQNTPQKFETGFTLRAQVKITPDNRFVRMKFIEKGTQLEGIDKIRVLLDNKGTIGVAEMPCVKESIVALVRNVPDGGAILLPLQFQPDGAKETGCRLVVRVDARTHIEAEEMQIRGEPDK